MLQIILPYTFLAVKGTNGVEVLNQLLDAQIDL